VYLRHSTVRKAGKSHTYWRLVRSVRNGRKVRQETVAHLGELDAQGRANARALARHITGGAEQRELFEDRPAPTTVEVRLDRVRIERARSFGDVWLGWTLWRALRLDEVCAEHMAVGREEVAWSTMAAILTIARLCDPSSELHIAEDWYRRTALEDLLGVPPDQVNDDRLYRALDQLLPHKDEWDDWSRHSEGCYLLRTNVTDWTPDALWQTYVQLTDAEAAFRIHKSDLSIRPIWHHKQHRVQAHIFVCFLAYAMWKTLEPWQKRAGLGNSPRTILYELGRIQSTDVVLLLACDERREVRIRCVVRPDRAQAALLDRLGLRLPERLRLPNSAKM
jgi:hypothetical protein